MRQLYLIPYISWQLASIMNLLQYLRRGDFEKTIVLISSKFKQPFWPPLSNLFWNCLLCSSPNPSTMVILDSNVFSPNIKCSESVSTSTVETSEPFSLLNYFNNLINYLPWFTHAPLEYIPQNGVTFWNPNKKLSFLIPSIKTTFLTRQMACYDLDPAYQ